MITAAAAKLDIQKIKTKYRDRFLQMAYLASGWSPEPEGQRHGAVFALRALLTSSQACLQHARALAARRWFQCIPGPSAAVRLSPSSSLFPATVARSAWPSRRAGPSPRCAAGRTNPALLP